MGKVFKCPECRSDDLRIYGQTFICCGHCEYVMGRYVDKESDLIDDASVVYEAME